MSGRYRVGLILALVLQLGLLVWMIADRAMLLQTGREVRLAVIPIDPRDLLRGDYVVLNYDISSLRSDDLAGDDNFNEGEAIYVALDEGADGAKAAAITRAEPATGPFLRGTVTDARPDDTCPVGPCMRYRVEYNIEQYFVPEGTGRALEEARNDQKVTVDVAVDRHGRAALKRLLVDGAVRDEQPLY